MIAGPIYCSELQTLLCGETDEITSHMVVLSVATNWKFVMMGKERFNLKKVKVNT